MRITLAAIRCEKGELDDNLRRHERVLVEAAAKGSNLALFPEMSLTGSVDPGTHPDHLVTLDDPRISSMIQSAAEHNVAVCFGVAERGASGNAYISQLVASGGRLLGLQRKRHLGEGEESFTSGDSAEVFHLGGVAFGLAICAEAGFDDPFDAATAAGARLVLFPAAPGLHGRRLDEATWRDGFLWWTRCSLGDATRNATRLRLWVALAGQAGSTVDEDFPGLAAVVNPDGEVVDRLPDWREGVLTVDVPL
ncbi:MAG: carbon-nitrogen hydrolase family protein [Acidimicrobiales bacterium]